MQSSASVLASTDIPIGPKSGRVHTTAPSYHVADLVDGKRRHKNRIARVLVDGRDRKGRLAPLHTRTAGVKHGLYRDRMARTCWSVR